VPSSSLGPTATPQRARSRQEDVREWLTAARAVVTAAHDVFPEARKDVLQVRRLALVVAPHGAGRDGDGHAVRGEVRDEPLDARQQLHVRPARVLCGGAPGEVVVDRERDVREEGEQIRRCGDARLNARIRLVRLILEEAGGDATRTLAHEACLYLPGHLGAILCENVICATGQMDGGRLRLNRLF
jgi:hypothetical protein